MQNLSEPGDDRNFSLALPKDVLADIIVNFLGQRERLAFDKEAFFILDLNDLRQFYLLMDAKISKEVNTRLEFFQVAINYDDDTSRTLTSIESLEKFHETRNVVPTGVTLTWHFVFRFPNAPTIETQKINLSFLIVKGFIDGRVQLSIEHSNPVWGIEVLNLLSNQLRKKISKVPHIASLWQNFIVRGFRLTENSAISTPILLSAAIGALMTIFLLNNERHSPPPEWQAGNFVNELDQQEARIMAEEAVIRFSVTNSADIMTRNQESAEDSESRSVLNNLFYSGKLNERELIILASLLDGKRTAYIAGLATQPSISERLREGLLNVSAAYQRDQEELQRAKVESQRKTTEELEELQRRKGKLQGEKAEFQRKKEEMVRTSRDNLHRYIQIFIAFFVATLLASLSLWSWIQYHRERSFLLLTDEAKSIREKFLQRKRGQVALGMGGMVVAILTGIIGNYVSAWLMK